MRVSKEAVYRGQGLETREAINIVQSSYDCHRMIMTSFLGKEKDFFGRFCWEICTAGANFYPLDFTKSPYYGKPELASQTAFV